MLGYIKPVKAELKVREWEAYQGIYCGLCKELGRNYGQLSRMTLNYDFVFLAMLSISLTGKPVAFSQKRCLTHPMCKRNCCVHNEPLSQSCDVAILLLYHKMLDNLLDGKWWEKILISFFMPSVKRAYKKATQNFPELSSEISLQMNRQRTIEQENCTSIDLASEPTAKSMEAIFSKLSSEPVQKRILERMGYLLGRWVYLMDALDDFTQDFKNGNYNVFILAYDINDPTSQNSLEARREAVASLYLTIAELSKAYDLLDLKGFNPILENIINLGLKESVDRATWKIEGLSIAPEPKKDE